MAETNETKLTWEQDLSFAVELQGHRFVVDASDKFGGKNRGPRPKPLLLAGLAGCTGMDVVSILNKKRVAFSSFSVEVKGEQTEEHPQVYRKIHITYRLRGSNIDRSKVERAVELSQTSYCGVLAMLKKSAEITSDIVIES